MSLKTLNTKKIFQGGSLGFLNLYYTTVSLGSGHYPNNNNNMYFYSAIAYSSIALCSI
jgi:hypothetical protein